MIRSPAAGVNADAPPRPAEPATHRQQPPELPDHVREFHRLCGTTPVRVLAERDATPPPAGSVAP